MTSREKLEQLLAYLKAPPEPGAAPAEFALRTALRLAPKFGLDVEAQLPADAGGLDELLEVAARWLLQLRSDDAPELVAIAVAVEEPPGTPAALPRG